jgi:hypothetical protein
LQKRHPDVLGDREPLIVRKQNLSLGTRPMINVRIPAPTREAANDLCQPAPRRRCAMHRAEELTGVRTIAHCVNAMFSFGKLG